MTWLWDEALEDLLPAWDQMTSRKRLSANQRSRKMMTRPAAIALCVVLWHCAPALAETIIGRVVGVHDGDTITVLIDRQQTKIRLHGIDSLESRQPFGSKAKAFTSSLAFGKTVEVDATDKDRYGRTVAIIILPDGRNLNHEIVRADFAWWFRKYAAPQKWKSVWCPSEAPEHHADARLGCSARSIRALQLDIG